MTAPALTAHLIDLIQLEWDVRIEKTRCPSASRRRRLDLGKRRDIIRERRRAGCRASGATGRGKLCFADYPAPGPKGQKIAVHPPQARHAPARRQDERPSGFPPRLLAGIVKPRKPPARRMRRGQRARPLPPPAPRLGPPLPPSAPVRVRGPHQPAQTAVRLHRSRSSRPSPPARFSNTSADTICRSLQPWRPLTATWRATDCSSPAARHSPARPVSPASPTIAFVLERQETLCHPHSPRW